MIFKLEKKITNKSVLQSNFIVGISVKVHSITAYKKRIGFVQILRPEIFGI